ncbi:hypothetical protein HPB51_001430 [Rhipicephalus microplus]|uniref:Uncharacterized protein n=1 Tax=Rhipicephalus microplus TaxID=6941 RepID=A0A9J6EEP6_RHIMP|nr:hypothetical protein HPB51_001430 [Rhipicephalus microplus]
MDVPEATLPSGYKPRASTTGAEAARRETQTSGLNHCFLRTWTEHAVASSPAAGGSTLLLGAGKHHGNEGEKPLRLGDEARRRSASDVVGANAHRSCVRDALTARRLRRMVKQSSGPTPGDRGNRRGRRAFFFSSMGRSAREWCGERGRMENRASLAGVARQLALCLIPFLLPLASQPSLHLSLYKADDDTQERD